MKGIQFKIGQRVRVKETSDGIGFRGKEGIVELIKYGFYYGICVRLRVRAVWFNESELESYGDSA